MNKADLVYSRRPRIVKLHGSFPSQRPFIVTDEDYRSYPVTFAPFVNTVRQALLENTLCLIGFSADDPNFLSWIGWIHDNLGRPNSAKMYLIGLLGLSDPQKKLLEQRNIVPVDLSGYGDHARDHHTALSVFLDFLDTSKAQREVDWPREGLTSAPDMRIDTLPQILKIIPVWRSQRESYPQWVIVPEDRRRRFWQDTREWINLVPLPEDVPEFVDLQFAFEFVWRLERCLRPIFGNLVGFLVTTVNRYLPMLDLDSSLGLRLASKGDTEEPALTREYIGRMCHHLLLSLMRYYREEGDLYSWKKVSIQLHDQLATLQPEYRAGHHYERALLALFELDPQAVRNRITEWPVDDLLPFWESKRAGLLAEIGQVSDAERILKSSLRTIRSSFHHKPITADYGGRSQESYVMLLLHAVRLSAAIQEGRYSELSELRKDFNDRWHSLRKYGCDPWNELDLFRRALDRPPRNTTDVEEEPSFDIGRVARTRRFLNEDREALDGYAFLRFCDSAKMPAYRSGFQDPL